MIAQYSSKCYFSITGRNSIIGIIRIIKLPETESVESEKEHSRGITVQAKVEVGK